ncbi:hypothetical protein ES703_71561 [subsurface metagenome]
MEFEYDVPYTEEYLRRRRLRHNAGRAVRQAVGDGRLKKPGRCQSCRRPVRPRKHKVKRHSIRYPHRRKYTYKLEAHHWSYYEEDLLDVKWLCTPCHRRADKIEPPKYPPTSKI